MGVQFRLCAADAAKYPEGKKAFTFDLTALLDMSASELMELESHLGGYTIGLLRQEIDSTGSAQALRAAMWIGRRLGGVTEKWEHFDPVVHRAIWEATDDEVEPEGPTGATAESPTS